MTTDSTGGAAPGNDTVPVHIGQNVKSANNGEKSGPSSIEFIQDGFQKITTADYRGRLRMGIKMAVETTNNALASLENSSENVSAFVGSRLRPLSSRAEYAARRAIIFYEERRTYGPQVIGGSATAMALLVGAKTKGKVIPAMVAGGLLGSLTYAAIYGTSSLFMTDIFRDKKNT